jgi:nitrate reductase delta subunit
VTSPDRQTQVFDTFAELLSYPAADPAPAARRCRALLGGREAGRHLGRFLERAERARPHELEEAYSATFDLDPACAPYVGHHLCGEGPRRGVFMARLADVYRADGFEGAAGGELPDHLVVVLRYLARVPAGEARQALLQDGLLPALDKMLAALPDSDDAYRAVLAALREEVT